MTEEARAALWRKRQRSRASFQWQAYAHLQGDPIARVALEKRWSPLAQWLAERNSPDWMPEYDIGQPEEWLVTQIANI